MSPWSLDLHLSMQSVPIATKVKFVYYQWWGVLDTTIWDKICQWPTAGQWFSQSILVSLNYKSIKLNIVESGIEHLQPYLYFKGKINLVGAMTSQVGMLY
jgi:hypothetical protein